MRSIVWFLVAAPVIALSACDARAQWERADTYLLGGALGLMAIDWGQTRYLSRQYQGAEGFSNCTATPTTPLDTRIECQARREPAYTEQLNPLLPRHPTVGDLDKYFAVAMIGTAGLAYILPTKYRRPFLGTVIVLESLVVLNNHRIGLRVSF